MSAAASDVDERQHPGALRPGTPDGESAAGGQTAADLRFVAVAGQRVSTAFCRAAKAVEEVRFPPVGSTNPVPDSSDDPTRFEPVVAPAAQEVSGTLSRWARPRAWLEAVVWLLEEKLHPKTCSRQARETTLAVAVDLAARMDYGRGWVLYDLQGTASRLGVDPATVKRHVGVLRELGALVWVRHGSKANLRLPGRPYTATATIYAAVIPPLCDAVKGHRLSGSGYAARIVGVTETGRELAVAEATAAAVDKQARRAVDNRCSGRRAPHSPGGSPRRQTVEVGGGLNNTPRQRASRSTTSSPLSNSSKGARRRPVAQVARDNQVTRMVRPMVTWTQGECQRRLAFALRPWIDRGWQEHQIAAELQSWWLTWRPARPAAYITARLRRAESHPLTEPLADEAPVDGRGSDAEAAWAAACAQQRTVVAKLADAADNDVRWAAAHKRQQALAAAFAGTGIEEQAGLRTDADRRQARAAGRYEPQTVLEHLEDFGPDDAIDLYGADLVATCERMRGRSIVTLGVAR